MHEYRVTEHMVTVPAKRVPLTVAWEEDHYPWDGDVSYEGPLWGCVVRAGGEVVVSLWAIACELGDDYAREIEQELIEEAIATYAEEEN